MKMHLTIAIVAMFLTVACFAGEVDINSDIKSGKKCIELNLDKNLGHGLGPFAYNAQKTGWGETYGGPTYAPNSHIQVGIGAGIESGQTSTRFGGFLWLGRGKTSLLALGEDGGSGSFYRLEGKYSLDSKTTVGILQEKNLHTGLLVERKLDSNLTLRGRVYNKKEGDIGVRVAF